MAFLNKFSRKKNYKSNYKHGDSDNEIVKSGMVFLIGAFFVAIFNYLYHLFMGRMLGPVEYGVLGSLFALIYISSNATTAFNLTISKFSAEFQGKNKDNALKSLIKRSMKRVSILGLIVLIVYFISIPFIQSFMNLNNYYSLIIVGLIAYFSILSAVLSGALNGLQKFVWQNSSGFFSALIKFSLAVILVFIGLGVNGALSAVLIGTLTGMIISAYPLKGHLNGSEYEKLDKKKIYNYIFFVFFALISSILIITMDQVLVKHYFSSADAGFYTAAGMIGKIIWFGSGFLIGPLFPKIVSLSAKGKNTSALLRKTLLYTFILALIGSIFYFLFPEFIVSILYGQEYNSINSMIFLFGIGMGLFSLSQIMIYYNLAKENYSFIFSIVIAFILEVFGIYFFHNSLIEVVYIFLLTNAIMFFSLLLYNHKEVFNLR